jgi:hypothetical protein
VTGDGTRKAQVEARFGEGAAGNGRSMGLIEIVLVVLLVLVILGAFGYGGGSYRTPGIGLGGILFILLLT